MTAPEQPYHYEPGRDGRIHNGRREACRICPYPTVEAADYEFEMEELIGELFNPADTDSYSPFLVLRQAAEFVQAQPCSCVVPGSNPEDPIQNLVDVSPDEVEQVCDRCQVLGRIADQVVER